MRGAAGRTRSSILRARTPFDAGYPQKLTVKCEQAHGAVAQAWCLRPAVRVAALARGAAAAPVGGSRARARHGSGCRRSRADRRCVVSGEPQVAADGSRSEPKLDMSSDAGRHAAREEQDELTRNVGRRLTREGHDSDVPRWKRWLGKG